MHDLVIRGGTVVNGTGAASFSGDVGISAGRVAEVNIERTRITIVDSLLRMPRSLPCCLRIQ